MARIPAGVDPTTLHIAARRVLLDSLSALRAHRHAIVVVGAQAVYARSEDAPLRVAPFTADADLGLDPRRLGAEPLLETAMVTAGFERGSQPGIWQRPEQVDGMTVPIAVDLLVPASFGGDGRRAATIPPHGRGAARKVAGLEPSIVDHDPLRLVSLEPDRDDRQITVNVAGVAALLVAKAFKISDRLAERRQGREADKDAGDVLRLMMTSDVAQVVARFRTLLGDPGVGATTAEGLVLLRAQFRGRRTDGTAMAAAALAGGPLDDRGIRDVAVAFIDALRVVP